jgi:cell division protein FtsA
VPQHVTGATEMITTPAHASAIGLLLHGSREGVSGSRVIGGAMGDSVAGAIGKVRGWLTRNF